MRGCMRSKRDEFLYVYMAWGAWVKHKANEVCAVGDTALQCILFMNAADFGLCMFSHE